MSPPGLSEFRITPHAIREIRRRGLTMQIVESVVMSPEQRFLVRPGRDVFQSRIPVEGGVRLVRVFVDTDETPPVVVTAYKTSRIAKYPETIDMKVHYDSATDTLTVILKDDARVVESDEEKPGVILDFDDAGDLVSLEILDASRRVSEARRVDFQMA